MAKKGPDQEKADNATGQDKDEEKKPATKAERFKNGVQRAIAISIFFLLALKLLYRVSLVFDRCCFGDGYLVDILRLPTLELVGKALAYSAGIDLAYMLTTDGPDEAIEPLILGLASAVLFSISQVGTPRIDLALEIGLYVLIMAGLFLMKEYFIKPDQESNFWKRILALRKTKR